MLTRWSKKLISVLLVAVMVISLFTILPISVSAAAKVTDLTQTTANTDGSKLQKGMIQASYDNTDITYSNTASSLYWKFTAKGAAKTVVISNISDTATSEAIMNKTISMKWKVGTGNVSISPTDNRATIDATDSSGMNWFTLKPGGSVTFTFAASSSYIQLYGRTKDSNVITDTVMSASTVTVNGADHGSVTVTGVGDTTTLNSSADSVSDSVESNAQVTLTAQPDTGYEFYGFSDGISWYAGGEVLSYDFIIQEDTVFTAFFYDPSAPMFRLGTRRFADLNSANAAAVASDTDKTIVLERSGMIPSAEISEGVSLVIPSASLSEGVWTEPQSTAANFVTPSAFRTLTLEPGAVLDISGTLSVNGTMKLAQATQSGPTGTVGEIVLSQGSVINLNDSATMYTWGYVYGDGDVNANDTSSVYEEMAVNDLRGGRATLDLYELNENNGFGCFPFEQYYVQNIESRLNISSTATEYITAGLNISVVFVRSAPFIGNGGVFQLEPGSTLTKYYDAVNDKLVVEVDGDAVMSNLRLDLAEGGMEMAIDSADYILPINNMWITQKSGLLTTHYKINLLPDSGLIINEGASVLIDSDSEVYIYDKDDLGAYNPKGNLVALSYSPTLGGKSNRTYANMVDSFVAVNGTLEVKGILNTTQNGANITSTNPKVDGNSYGKVIVHNKNVGEFWGAYQDSNRIVGYDSVPLNPPVLKNSNDTYRPTVARNNMDAEFYYVDLPNITDQDGNPLSVWVSSEDPDYFNVVWVDKDGATLQEKRVKNTELAIAEYTGEDIPSYTVENSGIVSKFYDFIGWESEYDVATQTLTYSPRYKATDAIALIWKSGNTEITRTYIRKLGKMTTADIPVEAINNWSIANLTTETAYSRYKGFTGSVKVADNTYLTDFDQSKISSYRLGSDTTLTVTWEEVTTSELYTVSWYDADGTTLLLSKEYFSNQNPVFDGEEPVYSDNSKIFYGWKLGSKTYEKTASLPKPTADVTYTAVYANARKVTWANYDGTELASAYYPNGAPVANAVYDGATPTRPADAQYTYKFSGWSAAAGTTITADITFTAQYKTFLNTYVITWCDEDGTTLDTDTMYYGSTPSYAGADPTKAEDEDYTYTFSGWTPTVAAVTGDVTYSAAYTSTPKDTSQYQFAKKSISLDGKIGVNFYIDMPSFGGQKIRFTYHDEATVFDLENETYPVKTDETTTEYYYLATWYVDAPEMTDVIKAELLAADGVTVLADTEYSVADYIGNDQYQIEIDAELKTGERYLTGTILGVDQWPDETNSNNKLLAQYKMHENPANPGEYMITDVALKGGDEIKGVVYNGAGTALSWYHDGTYQNLKITSTGTYTVYCKSDWSMYAEKQTGTSTILSLLRAMDSYGNKAQTYFKDTTSSAHITGIPAYGAITSEELAQKLGDNAENIKTVDFTSVGLKYYGSSLLLDSGTKLRHYFHVEDQSLFDSAKSNVYFGGKKVEAQIYSYNSAQGYIYFDLEVPAAELDEAKVISINGVEARFSALDYVKRALVRYEEAPTDEATAELADLMTSLYWYNIFADEFFNH